MGIAGKPVAKAHKELWTSFEDTYCQDVIIDREWKKQSFPEGDFYNGPNELPVNRSQ